MYDSSFCCPNCGSTSLRRSRTGGLLRLFGRLMFLRPVRCQTCQVRFWRSTGAVRRRLGGSGEVPQAA